MACTIGMSRFGTASTSSEPMPGKANTYSTTTTPPASHARLRAMTCRVGAMRVGQRVPVEHEPLEAVP